MLPVKSSLLPTVSKFFDDDWNSLFDWTNRNYSGTSHTMPSVNVQENDHEFIVDVAAPGMKKDDFKIELNNNLLFIKSEMTNEKDLVNEENFTRKEFNYQSFQRSFTLNDKIVDEANIKAVYKDGILSITLPKKEEAKPKPSRIIKIS